MRCCLGLGVPGISQAPPQQCSGATRAQLSARRAPSLSSLLYSEPGIQVPPPSGQVGSDPPTLHLLLIKQERPKYGPGLEGALGSTLRPRGPQPHPPSGSTNQSMAAGRVPENVYLWGSCREKRRTSEKGVQSQVLGAGKVRLGNAQGWREDSGEAGLSLCHAAEHGTSDPPGSVASGWRTSRRPCRRSPRPALTAP